MSAAIRPEDAETRVLEAALRVLAAGLGDMHADSDADAEYASEQLALAARELTRATDASDRKPVGWNDTRALISRRAEELHAEHHSGYIVPSLDSCPEHDRAEYEAMAPLDKP